MHVKINDLMVAGVITAGRDDSIAEVREKMRRKAIHAVPIVDLDNRLIGILTAIDLIDELSPEATVASVMNGKVYTVPKYSDVHIAARLMRNHHIHHVVVTDESEVVGIISSFDLLKLVEEHRFVMKNPPTASKKRGERV